MNPVPSGLSILLLGLLLGCADFGQVPATAISGQVNDGPGVVFLERGLVQQGTFERASRIHEDGRFAASLPSAGTWGVHTYVAEYIYLPLQVEVEEGFVTPVAQPAIAWQVFRNQSTWNVDGRQPADLSLLRLPIDPDKGDDPAITNPHVRAMGQDAVEVSVDVMDPNGDLSRQVLAYFTGTGDGLQLNPPASPVNDFYPDGTYRAVYYVPEGVDATLPWHFVAADHGCSVSEILEARPKP